MVLYREGDGGGVNGKARGAWTVNDGFDCENWGGYRLARRVWVKKNNKVVSELHGMWDD